MPNTPSLRFPEFSGEWEIVNLEQVVKVIDGDRGVNYPKSNDFSEEGFCLFLNAKNVTKNGFSFNETYFISQEKDQNLNKGKLELYDIVLTTRGSIGNFAYYSDFVPYRNMRINSGMVIIRTEENLFHKYLYIYFKSQTIEKQLKVISFGSAQPQLTVKDIKKIKVAIPSLPEQQKIADFLTAIDEKITLTTDKISQLETYKRGMMQKLLSGALRFPGFSGEWREVKLGEVSDITTGKSNREDSTENDGEYTFFDRSEDVRTSSQYLFDGEAVIIAGEGQRFLPKYFIGKFDLHQRTYAIMNFHNAIGKYIFYYLSYFGNRYFLSQAVGTTVKSLRLPMFKKMEMKLPPKKEQQKIADFLSSLDDKLIIEKEKLDQLKTYKQGLLQKMFV